MSASRVRHLTLRPASLLATAALAFGVGTGTARASPPSKEECMTASEAAQRASHPGTLREARKNLLLCVAEECPGPIRADCKQRLGDVDAELSTVVFKVTDAHGNGLAAVHVMIDGETLASSLDGSELTVETGDHNFTFDAPGLAEKTETLTIEKGQKRRVVTVTLGAPAAASEAVPGFAAHGVSPDGQRTLGLVIGGVGLATLLFGTYLAIKSKSTYDDALNHCTSGTTGCDATGIQGGSDAHAQATGATAGFVVGTLLVAGGVGVYFTAPKARVAARPIAGRRSLGLDLEVSW